MVKDEKLGFGRHTNSTYGEVDAAYLKWMIESKHRLIAKAIDEMNRRGLLIPKSKDDDLQASLLPSSQPKTSQLKSARADDEDFFSGIATDTSFSTKKIDFASAAPSPPASTRARSPSPDVDPFSGSVSGVQGMQGLTMAADGFKLIKVSPGGNTLPYYTQMPKDKAYKLPHVDMAAAISWTEANFKKPTELMRARVLATWLSPEPIVGRVEKMFPLVLGDTLPRACFRPDVLPEKWPYGKERFFCPTVDELEVEQDGSWVPYDWQIAQAAQPIQEAA